MEKPDERFMDKGGFCKLCHKVCFDSEEDALKVVNSTNLGLRATYPCRFYPSGYWHVTRQRRKFKVHHWTTELKKLGPIREEKLLVRIERILAS